MKNRFDVSGKVVIVTGGTKGLGEAIVAGFADSGARVALCSRSQADCDAGGSANLRADQRRGRWHRLRRGLLGRARPIRTTRT